MTKREGIGEFLVRKIAALRGLPLRRPPAGRCEKGDMAPTDAPDAGATEAGHDGPHVLLIGGDSKPDASLASTLGGDGFEVHSVVAVDAALGVLRGQPVAMVVVSGQSVAGTCLSVRQVSSAPILVLLPVMAEEDILDAFAAGADDCQSAIIGDREVLLRVRAVLRRAWSVGGRA